MSKLFKVSSDALYICQRLKEVDESYFILFNVDKNKFEVHSSAQYENSYCFTLPYENLDTRAIDYALKTRSQNLDELIRQIDRENEMLTKNSKKEIMNKVEEVLS